MQKTGYENITDQMQKCIEKAKQLGASGAKVRYWLQDDTSCDFENGRLKKAESHESISYEVTVLANGKIGKAAGNDLDDIDELTNRAMTLSKIGSIAHFDAYPAPAPVEDVKTYSTRTAELSMDDMIGACEKTIEKLRKFNSELYICSGAHRSTGEGGIITSSGVNFQTRRSSWQLGSFVQKTEGTDMLFSGYGRSWLDLNEYFDPDYITERILEDLRWGNEIVEAPQGDVPVFTNPEQTSTLFWGLSAGYNGRSVAKGESPLRGRLGEQILDPSLTIVDNPHIDYSYGASEIDHDGIPTKKMTIYENGVLKNFLYDLDTAGMVGATPTGNNGCSPYFTVVTPGKRSSQELLAGIEDGLYLKELIGFGQSNLINGDFSSNVSLGFRVKNGKIVGRVKDTMVSGNLYEVMKSNVQISSDIDPVNRYPYLVLSGIHVHTK